MILFLTLAYCVVLVALIKLKVLKPTKLVKASPAVWMLGLLVFLFIPMQFWAPAGQAQNRFRRAGRRESRRRPPRPVSVPPRNREEWLG